MDVKEAISRAKQHVVDIFISEDIRNVGLEEVRSSEYGGAKEWKVTIGFSRPWDNINNNLIGSALNLPQYRRTYKVVTIDDNTGEVLSISNRPKED